MTWRDRANGTDALAAVAACAVAVTLHVCAALLLPDIHVRALRASAHRVVLVQFPPAVAAGSPPPAASPAAPPAAPPAGDGASQGGGPPAHGPAGGGPPVPGMPRGIVPAADVPDPGDVSLMGAEAFVGPPGEGDGLGPGRGSGRGGTGGPGTGGGDSMGFVVYDQKPALLRLVPADYPPAARALGVRGTVLVRVLVRGDGQVADAVVVQGIHALLDRAAIEAARACTFAPARQHGIPAPAWVTLSYAFTPP